MQPYHSTFNALPTEGCEACFFDKFSLLPYAKKRENKAP